MGVKIKPITDHKCYEINDPTLVRIIMVTGRVNLI